MIFYHAWGGFCFLGCINNLFYEPLGAAAGIILLLTGYDLSGRLVTMAIPAKNLSPRATRIILWALPFLYFLVFAIFALSIRDAIHPPLPQTGGLIYVP